MIDFGNPNQQKWGCFCCGLNFLTHSEFQSHITEKHEEGRDYLLCPLKRCRAAVRCVKSHFEAKHPTEKVPKNCQLQAMIWKDFSNKKKKTKKPQFKEGYMVSPKNDGKPMHYRSGYEKTVYECLEVINEVVSYNVEPFSVPYYFKGEPHKYYPDVSVLFNDGRIEIWEIKPANQTKTPINQAKWDACGAFCQQRDWEFIIQTETGIELLKNKAKHYN